MRPMLSKLKIHVNKKMESNIIVVKNHFSALNSIEKNSREKDKRAAWRVITTSLVSHHLRKGRYMRQTCIDLNLNGTTLRRALSWREKIDDSLQNETWAFGGRLPHFDKKLSNDVKEEITQFWHSSSWVSPNAKDVLKLRIGIKDRMPHPTHYLEVSQTMLFKQFREIHPRLHVS